MNNKLLLLITFASLPLFGVIERIPLYNLANLDLVELRCSTHANPIPDIHNLERNELLVAKVKITAWDSWYYTFETDEDVNELTNIACKSGVPNISWYYIENVPAAQNWEICTIS